MRIRISSYASEMQMAQTYIWLLMATLAILGIIFCIITGFQENSSVIMGLSFFVFFPILFLLLIGKYVKLIRIAYMDSTYMILKSGSSSEIVNYNKIKSLEYHWFPLQKFTESSILVIYESENGILKKAIIIPTQLDTKGKFKFKRNIMSLLKDKITESKEK
jgi:hypothetical protein